jgi:hypothetical protein
MLIIAGFVAGGWAATGDNLTQTPITYDASNAIVYHPEFPTNCVARYEKDLGVGNQTPQPMEQKPSNPPRILWGTDVLVDGASIRTPEGVDMQSWTGTPIYVAVGHNGSGGTTGDSVLLYKSTDNGYTWSYISAFYCGVANQTMTHINLLVGTGANTEIQVGCVYNNNTTNHGDLVIGRWDAAGTWLGFYWPRGNGNPDTVQQMTMARSNDNAWAATIMFQHTTGASPDTLIDHLTTTDYGASWTFGVNRSGSHDPHIAFGNAGLAMFTYRSNYSGQGIGEQRSTNNGASWSGSSFVTTDTITWDPRVALDHANPIASQVGWIIYRYDYNPLDFDVYYAYTTDGGGTWNLDNVLQGSTALELLPDIFCAPESPGTFVRASYETYVGGDFIAYQSADASDPTNWSTAVNISDYVPTGTMPAHPRSNGAGNGCLVYERPGPIGAWYDYWSFTGVEEKGITVAPKASFDLAQARPNPLSKSTAIAFSLPKSGSVDLAVYDIAGRKVATLAQGTMSAGNHEVSWNGANAPVGVYLYRLSFEGKTLTNRMVVVK